MRLNGALAENPEQNLHLAVASYRPRPYVGRVLFFKAAVGPAGDTWNYSLGWVHLVTGEFEVCEAPGDHRSMFLEPNVQTLANNMMKYFCHNGSERAAVG